jgi:endonuclease/exonuclease/phosphatase family metal-dependent hydrolase
LRLRVRAILAAALAVLVGPAVLPTPASAVELRPFTALHWNVSGWVMHGNSTTDGLVDRIVSAITTKDADFAGLNEICWDQYQAVQSKLADAGWPDSDNFARFEMNMDTGICGGKPFGIALFSKAALGVANRYRLEPQNRAELSVGRKLLCAPVTGRKLRYCVTHITPNSATHPEFNAGQIDHARQIVDGFINAGDTVVTAGDFNVTPRADRLNGWYSSTVDTPYNSGNSGRHLEMDDQYPVCPGFGRSTTNDDPTGACNTAEKIDMIFVSVNNNGMVGPHTAGVLQPTCNDGALCSDHRVLWGSGALRV